MQILLFILKVIGIILLILLGLLFGILALVLLVPIRYELNGEIEDEHKLEAGGVIRYLFSMLKITVVYRNGKLETDVYLFGFRKKKKVLEAEESESSYLEDVIEDIGAKEAMETDEESDEVVQEPEVPATNVSVVEEESQQGQSVQMHESSNNIPTEQKAEPEKSTASREKKTKSKKGESKFPLDLVKRELTDEHNHNIIKKVIRELKYLFTHFGFRKIKTDLCFGAGNPALTGQLLGILAMFPILYRYEFGIIPDFETDKAYIKGTFAVVGRIRLVHILITACRLLFDKEVRMVIKKFMDMQNQ